MGSRYALFKHPNEVLEVMMSNEKNLRDRVGSDVYDRILNYNKGLQDASSEVGKILSMESIMASARNIEEAEVSTIVNNGHGVMLKALE